MRSSISIVIPTLGHKHINKTLESIFNNSYKPHEVIIAIPKNYIQKNLIKEKFKQLKKVKFIITPSKGQVYQRIYGFKNAIGDYVLQLDDDVQLDKHCLKNLILGMVKLRNVALSPTWIDKRQLGSSFDQIPKNLFFKLYHFILNGVDGYVEGTVSKAGVPYATEPSNLKKELSEVDWLAGGCILHEKKNLLTKI